MRNPKRIPRILAKLQKYWAQDDSHADLRLCQLLNNAARQQGWATTDIFCVEDELIENWLDQRLDGLP